MPKIADLNTCRDIFRARSNILGEAFDKNPEEYSIPSRTSMMEFLEKKVNGFHLNSE